MADAMPQEHRAELLGPAPGGNGEVYRIDGYEVTARPSPAGNLGAAITGGGPLPDGRYVAAIGVGDPGGPWEVFGGSSDHLIGDLPAGASLGEFVEMVAAGLDALSAVTGRPQW